jgi:hypothetical protein
MRMRFTLASAVLATMFATTAAQADSEPKGVDWTRVLVDMDTVARKGADVLDTPRCSPAGCLTDTNATAAAPERIQKLSVQNTANDLFGFAPTVGLVARDWNNSFKVTGDRLALVDALRLTSSTRMVLGRVRMSNTRIAPFAQVGLGQWRTDPYLMPLTPRYTEIAAQAAGGVELRLVGTWQVALESTMTMLYREQREAGDYPATRMWSTSIASRVDF